MSKQHAELDLEQVIKDLEEYEKVEFAKTAHKVPTVLYIDKAVSLADLKHIVKIWEGELDAEI